MNNTRGSISPLVACYNPANVKLLPLNEAGVCSGGKHQSKTGVLPRILYRVAAGMVSGTSVVTEVRSCFDPKLHS